MTYKPDAYPDLAPYLLVSDVEASITWLEAVLGATRLRIHRSDDGAINHGEVRIGDAVVMLGQSPGGPGAHVHLYLPAPDAAMERAVSAGGVVVQAMAERDGGDRRGGVRAPDGTTWWLAQQMGGS